MLPGGMGMATLTTTGQAEGVEVTLALEEGSEGVTADDIDQEAGTVSVAKRCDGLRW